MPAPGEPDAPARAPRPAPLTPPPPLDGSQRRALVTGGAGFIGSHLVDVLVARGDRVTVVDDLSTGRAANLAGALERIEFIRADLGVALPALAQRPPFDEIYHLAAAVGVKRVIERPIESIETNVNQTAALLRFASGQMERGAPGPRTFLASSSEVYGKSSAPVFSEEGDCVLGPTTALRWSYAASKAIDEHLALAHRAQSGLAVVIGRFFNTVGPRQVGSYGMVLPRFVEAVLRGHAPVVLGDGLQTRCFCDVRDVAPAVAALTSCPAAVGLVVNVGSDQPISMLALAELVVKTLSGKVAPMLRPYDAEYGPGFEDLRQRRPDLARVRRLIGFASTIALEQTIRDLAREMTRAGAAAPTVDREL